MKSTRDIGRKLEEYVLAKVKEIDPSARIYTNSKQKDIMCNFAFGECKKRNTKDFTIKEDIWLHLNNNLPINTKKFCFMVHENINNKRLITLDLEEFFYLIKTLHNLGELNV
jgi:hypothetical protein